MTNPFEGSGVPDDLQRMLSDGKVLGRGEQELPHPHKMPGTYTDTRFRNCYHRWVPRKDDDGNYVLFDLEIIDVPRAKVYYYALPVEGIDQVILELAELKKVVSGESE